MNYMVTVDMTDEQIKALILSFLRRRKCWGGKYFNTQKLVRYLGQDVLGDGKEVSRVLKDLIKDSWLNFRKKGDTVSLNTAHIREISEQINEHLLPEFS